MVEGGKDLNLKEGQGFNYSAEALPDNFVAFSANGKRYGPPNEIACNGIIKEMEAKIK